MTQFQPPPPPGPPAPPRRKHTVRNTLLILPGVPVAAYLALQLVLVGAVVVAETDADRLVPFKQHEVQYKVSGESRSAFVIYKKPNDRPGTLSTTDIRSAWSSETYTYRVDPPFLTMTASNRDGETGEISCEIWLDGEQVASGSASGPQAHTDCSLNP